MIHAKFGDDDSHDVPFRALASSAPSDGGGANHVPPEVVILAPFLLLALGAFLRHSTMSLPIPYTMQLLLVGGILGFFLRDERWIGTLQASVEVLGNMDPHLMLHVFLPPLIFESAASLEWHLVNARKWYIFTLAGPGLLLASGLTGQVLNAMLQNADKFDSSVCPNNSWPAQAGLMLGVILSATDPVAVVALLKDLGCKASLSTAIEGESLLNDGTALVMFTILVKIVEGDDSDGWDDYIWTFVKMSFGGALFGTLFAFIAVKWLGSIFNDGLSEITITLAAAYLCFFIAEHFLHVSGVLAVVCLGLYFGRNGRTAVSPEVEHFLEENWELLAYFGNTLIFVVAGIVIGYKMPLVPVEDVARLAIMYVACTIIRAFVIGIVYMLFRTAGVALDRSDQIIGVWGGLRGAVGLSLAMMVFDNSRICEPIRDEVMFHTAGIVVLTVCINSSTMPKLISILDMDTVAPSQQLIHDQTMTSLIKAGTKQELHLRADHLFDSTAWDQARKFYFQPMAPGLPTKQSKMNNKDDDALDAKEARRRVLMITKKSYWRQFQDGLLSNHAVKYLMMHTDLAFDDDCNIREWDTYAQNIRLISTINRQDEEMELDNLSPSDRVRRKTLAFLDSVPVLIAVLALVVISCFVSLVLDIDSVVFLVIDHATMFIFMLELSARLYCIRSWHSFAIDPYLMTDALVVGLDVILLGAGNIFGAFSGYTNSFRTIRFLKLIRFLRFRRVADKIRRTKIAAMNEPTSLWERTGSLAKRYQRRILYAQLKNGYEIASGFKVAREEVLAAFEHIQSSMNNHLAIRSGIEKDIRDVRSALLEMQRLYSEIAASITTSVAARTVLNRQRHALRSLHSDGLIDFNEYTKIKGLVEVKMKMLNNKPPLIAMPKKVDFLSQIPWLESASQEEMSAIAAAFEDSVFQSGDVLVQQNDSSDSVHILARGSVVVLLEPDHGETVEVDELGMGSVFGEISFCLGTRRGASIVASSSGLLFTISGPRLREFVDSNKELETRLWKTCGLRLAENLLSTHMEQSTSRRQVRDFVHDMVLHSVDPMNKNVCFNTNGHVVLLRGTALLKDEIKVVDGPCVVESFKTNCLYEVDFSTDAKFMCQKNTLSEKRNRSALKEGASASRRSSIFELEFKGSSALAISSAVTQRASYVDGEGIGVRVDDSKSNGSCCSDASDRGGKKIEAIV